MKWPFFLAVLALVALAPSAERKYPRLRAIQTVYLATDPPIPGESDASRMSRHRSWPRLLIQNGLQIERRMLRQGSWILTVGRPRLTYNEPRRGPKGYTIQGRLTRLDSMAPKEDLVWGMDLVAPDHAASWAAEWRIIEEFGRDWRIAQGHKLPPRKDLGYRKLPYGPLGNKTDDIPPRFAYNGEGWRPSASS